MVVEQKLADNTTAVLCFIAGEHPSSLNFWKEEMIRMFAGKMLLASDNS